jgi:hypothetical protein
MGKKSLFIFYYYGEGYAAGIQNKRLADGLLCRSLNIKLFIDIRKTKILKEPFKFQHHNIGY